MFPLANARKSAQAGGYAGANTLQDRAPRLKDAVERLVGALVTGLQTMAGTMTAIEGGMAGAALEPLSDVISAHPADAVAGLVAGRQRRVSHLFPWSLELAVSTS